MQNPQQFGNNPGEYEFDIKSILSRAQALSKINNWLLVRALLTLWAAVFVVYFGFIDAYGVSDLTKLISGEITLSALQHGIMAITLTSIQAPLWTGISMLALSFLRAKPQPYSYIFTYFKALPGLAVAYLLVSTAFEFGLLMFIIPGFYIFTATTFTLPLMADKNLGPIKAIVYSVKMTNAYLGQMLLLYAVFAGLFLVVFVTAGFAYLWIGPFYFNAKAVLYQDLFCRDELEPSNKTQSVTNDGVFNA